MTTIHRPRAADWRDRFGAIYFVDPTGTRRIDHAA
ncbi:hypothetical protein JOE61_001169 [Nocardioides salarius]|uniref:Uncharacterized protein n=1 Tax=Nocardioides salarius TaxID=374513 RepID=A0ABS2M834_9ACTN|nr:hypothetical protein [Nocardioides salarius]